MPYRESKTLHIPSQSPITAHASAFFNGFHSISFIELKKLRSPSLRWHIRSDGQAIGPVEPHLDAAHRIRKVSDRVGVFVKHVFRRAAEFYLERCEPLFDAENRRPLGVTPRLCNFEAICCGNRSVSTFITTIYVIQLLCGKLLALVLDKADRGFAATQRHPSKKIWKPIYHFNSMLSE